MIHCLCSSYFAKTWICQTGPLPTRTPRKHPRASVLTVFITLAESLPESLPRPFLPAGSFTKSGAIERYTVRMTKPSENEMSGRPMR